MGDTFFASVNYRRDEYAVAFIEEYFVGGVYTSKICVTHYYVNEVEEYVRSGHWVLVEEVDNK